MALLEEYIKSRLMHNSDTGKLYWRATTEQNEKWNNRYAGKECFNTRNNTGDLFGMLDGKAYLKKNIIWALHYGYYPTRRVMYRDGNKMNCTIGNLYMDGANHLLDVL